MARNQCQGLKFRGSALGAGSRSRGLEVLGSGFRV